MMRLGLKRRHALTLMRPAMLFLVVLIFLSIGSTDCWACPNCKDAVANESHQVQQGYVLSILLMMGTPFAIIAGWIIAIIRLSHKRRGEWTAEARLIEAGPGLSCRAELK